MTVGLEGTIATAGKPVVVDADALNWLAQQESWWERVPAELLVLTPHPGEMARLVGVDVDEIVGDPERIAREAATRWRQTVVLKGGRTVVASADGTIRCRRRPAVTCDRRQRRCSLRFDWRVAGAGAQRPGCRGSGGLRRLPGSGPRIGAVRNVGHRCG